MVYIKNIHHGFDFMSDCFTAAIVKGMIEHNDAKRYFGSLLAFKDHLRVAQDCGVVIGEGREISVTELGRAWYEDKKMNELSETRAYLWSLERKDEDWSLDSVKGKVAIPPKPHL